MRTSVVVTAPLLVVACSGTSDFTVSSGAGGASLGTAGISGTAADGAGSTAFVISSAGTGASVGAGAGPLGGAGSGGSAGATAGASSDGASGGQAGITENGGSAGAAPSSWPCPRSGPCVILPLGDSITFGYGSTTGGGYRLPLFSRALADRKSVTFVGSLSSGPATLGGQPFPRENEGHSGYSIDDSSSTHGISPLVDHALVSYEPNIVLLMIGTNDMHYKLDLANAPSRLAGLLDQITTDAPNALLVVAQIIPANGAQNTPTRAYNAAIPSVIRARTAQGKHLVLVDMYAALDHWSTALYKDSEHPNDAGYSAMADTWYAAIHSLLP